jgi:hypothetical protein
MLQPPQWTPFLRYAVVAFSALPLSCLLLLQLKRKILNDDAEDIDAYALLVPQTGQELMDVSEESAMVGDAVQLNTLLYYKVLLCCVVPVSVFLCLCV